MSVTYYVALPFVRTEDGARRGKRRNVRARQRPIERPKQCRAIL